jgi:3-oxoadipate enol-lactonase
MDVRANGLRFNCEVHGPQDAPWLVCSNSLMTNLSVWDAQVSAFANTHRVLRYDQRGHGSTEVPADPCSIDILADDALALMDAHRIERCVFMGVSMGAVSSLRLAMRHPSRVTRAIVVDGQWAAPPGAVELWEGRIGTATADGMEELVEPTIQRWFTPEFVTLNPPALEQVRGMIRTTPVAGFISCARALQRYDLRQDAAGIRVPVLLVVGAADGALPRVLREMHRGIPGSMFVEIPDAGHLPNVERAATFNAAIAVHLDG